MALPCICWCSCFDYTPIENTFAHRSRAKRFHAIRAERPGLSGSDLKAMFSVAENRPSCYRGNPPQGSEQQHRATFEIEGRYGTPKPCFFRWMTYFGTISATAFFQIYFSTPFLIFRDGGMLKANSIMWTSRTGTRSSQNAPSLPYRPS